MYKSNININVKKTEITFENLADGTFFLAKVDDVQGAYLKMPYILDDNGYHNNAFDFTEKDYVYISDDEPILFVFESVNLS